MSGVRRGDRIAIHYLMQAQAGEVLAASTEGKPTSVLVGAANQLPGLNEGVIGMQVGESKILNIAPQDAFAGPSSSVIEREVAKDKLPRKLAVGDHLRLCRGREKVDLWIRAEQPSRWCLSTQHPWALLHINLKVTLVGI